MIQYVTPLRPGYWVRAAGGGILQIVYLSSIGRGTMIENGRMQEVRSGKWLGRIEVVKGKLVAYPAGSEEAPVREDEVW